MIRISQNKVLRWKYNPNTIKDWDWIITSKKISNFDNNMGESYDYVVTIYNDAKGVKFEEMFFGYNFIQLQMVVDVLIRHYVYLSQNVK